jgi:predicted transcriptional regulator
MTETKIHLSDELRRKVDEIARDQNRDPADVMQEAVRRYVALQRFEKFVEKNEERARNLGIREEDVPGLVEEVRREKRDRGR